jgi:hypothetical protein
MALLLRTEVDAYESMRAMNALVWWLGSRGLDPAWELRPGAAAFTTPAAVRVELWPAPTMGHIAGEVVGPRQRLATDRADRPWLVVALELAQ